MKYAGLQIAVMNEKFLQYIWQHQLFDKTDMKANSGESIQVIHPGQWNSHQGPDFLHATVRINKTKWVGHIELHVFSSHWITHHHDQDPFYQNIILHVVWREDQSVGNRFPTFELEGRVSKRLLNRYDQLLASATFIPCEKMIHTVSDLVAKKMIESCFVRRLLEKSKEIGEWLIQAKGSWDEVSWWMLARQFGQPVNSLPFFDLAKRIEWKTISRHRHQLIQLEALLLGQSGVLQIKTDDPYIKALQHEYRFLRRKLSLDPFRFPMKFLRMRPANFPTVRLAQLASLIQREQNLFDRLSGICTRKQGYEFFETEISAYWLNHYRPGDETHYHRKNLGKSFCNHLLINLVVPLKFSRGVFLKDESIKSEAVNLMYELPPEDNRITRGFLKLGISVLSAADSQALLELKTQFCDQLLCLKCGIGHSLLKRDQDSQ